MVSDTSRKWVAAATTLAEDPTAQVACPKCGWEYLSVSDVRYENDPTMFSRYLRCESCGSVEIIDRLRDGATHRAGG